jgi:CubicO group peptidase (beta-lactamase class C family)
MQVVDGTRDRSLTEAVDAIAEREGFAGVVRVDRDGEPAFARTYGLADRAHRIPNTVDTRFAIASGSKGLTALTIASLIEDGALALATTARSVLGGDLPLIDDAVTVEHLLAHRSGIGDYLDEEAGHDLADYALAVPAHALATTEQFLAVLDGHAAKFAPGERFSYCNGGYVVLALIAERVGGAPFHDLVAQRVCAPARMRDTAFLRSDELPARTAVGYLSAEPGARTNIFHLPVRGNGDGGIYSTVADISAFWRHLFTGDIVPLAHVAEMVRPRSDVPPERYGLGFWLHATSAAVILEGCDAGVSFQTMHHPRTRATYTVLSNNSDGAWPLARFLYGTLAG